MTGWTPEAIVDAVLKLGTPLAIFAAGVYLASKLIDLARAWVARKKDP